MLRVPPRRRAHAIAALAAVIAAALPAADHLPSTAAVATVAISERSPAEIAKLLGTPSLDAIDYPDGVAPSAREVTLGKTLFFDPRLSKPGTMSCATCHNPDLGFGDGMALGQGVHGNRLGRNTPHLYNLAWNRVFFWDGRASSLEEQALGPIQAAGEMDMDLPGMVARLRGVTWYRDEFTALYGANGLVAENIGKAIAGFERTLVSRNAPFDRWLAGDAAAMSPEAVRGAQLFVGKARCNACHSGPNLTDESFHNIGTGDADAGRAKFVPGTATLTGAFKTSGLRNVLLTAPYLHDGSEASLEAVVRFYNQGGRKPTTDPLIKPLGLDGGEILDLVAFLGALTDPLRVDRPQVPR